MVDPKEATDAGSNPAEKKPEGNKPSGNTKKPAPSWAKKAAPKTAKPIAPTTSNSFKGGIKAIEDDTFFYGKGMTTKWLKSKDRLLAYIGGRFTMNEAKSLEKGELVLIGYNKRDEIQTQTDYDALSFSDKEFYKLDIKKYSEAEAAVKRNLSTCFSIIWNQMDRTLKNQVEKDPRYAKAYDDLDAPKLYTIMSDICNSSSTVDHYESRYVELLYNLLMCSGKNHTLAEYYELFNHRVKSAQAAGVDFMSVGYRQDLIDEASVTFGGDQDKIDAYIANNLEGELEKVKNRVLAIIFMKRAGPAYDHCRKEINNDFTKGTNNFPDTVDKAYSILQNYEVLAPTQQKTGGVSELNSSTRSKTGLSFQQKGDFH